MDSLPARASRVLGAFAILLGASVALDAHAWRVGGLLAASGAAAMLWGLITAARRRPVPKSESSQRDALDQETP